jgi:hypothetical protein
MSTCPHCNSREVLVTHDGSVAHAWACGTLESTAGKIHRGRQCLYATDEACPVPWPLPDCIGGRIALDKWRAERGLGALVRSVLRWWEG